MFVLPPPPRYPNGNLYTGMPGMNPLLETNNTLEHPTGPEYQLVVGEGTYVLRDSLHLATPPPHPSDAPQPINNPLAPNNGPPSTGTKLSIATLAPRKPPSHNIFRMTSGKSALPPTIHEDVQGPKGDGVATNGFGSASYYSQTPGFSDGNPALQPAPVKGKKDQKAKPKNNIVKSNSSYVSRVIPHESLSKRLSDRSPEGLVIFANINRAFMWLDLSSDIKVENLTKVLFTKAHVLAHDVNVVTKAANHLDLVMGCNTGDIIWYEPMSQKYARLNKNGMINPTAISSIYWLPNKENMFVAGHMDGTLFVYDKEKEDAEFAPEDDTSEEEGAHENGQSRNSAKFRILKSVQSRNQKSNPIAAWKVSNMKVNGMAFSPDGQRLAVVCEDGCLSIIDYINERVVDTFRSYYGAMLCVTWSPDGHYVLTGGQDDLICIWSLADRALVARCVGHHSWVTDIKFDPWRCDERNYRFGSVGEDCRLLLWDFSVGMLGRPKAVMQRNRASILSNAQNQDLQSATRLRSGSNRSQSDDTGPDNVVHAVEAKSNAAVLPPVMSKLADNHPLSWVGFEENCIITACKDGHIREWDRPKDASSETATTAGANGVAQT